MELEDTRGADKLLGAVGTDLISGCFGIGTKVPERHLVRLGLVR
ncbi:MAG: hypothetical protein ACLPTF_13910 [Steroidobacteraceae bacterium]